MNDSLASIDRLATGELDEPARRELFAWLDAEPTRWRRCALALLETRELEDAFAERAASAAPLFPALRPPPPPRFRWQSLTALAASLLIAFSLGAWAHGRWHVPAAMIAEAPKAAPLEKVNRPSPHSMDTQGTDLPDSDVQEKTIAKAGVQPEFIPPYVRSQWERRGYQVTSQQVNLPVVLPDGQRMLYPANEVQFNYVGQRTY